MKKNIPAASFPLLFPVRFEYPLCQSTKKSNSRLFFPAAIPNLARVIFCISVKDQKPVQKTEQIDSQQNPAFPDFPGQNTARAKIDYRMPVVDDNHDGGIIVEIWMTRARIVCHVKKDKTIQIKNNLCLRITHLVFCQRT